MTGPNSNVVWSPENGWHNGPPAATELRDARLVITQLAQLENDLAAWHKRGRSVIIDTDESEES